MFFFSFPGWTSFYKGTIINAHVDGAVDVKFDDGDYKLNLRGIEIRNIVSIGVALRVHQEEHVNDHPLRNQSPPCLAPLPEHRAPPPPTTTTTTGKHSVHRLHLEHVGVVVAVVLLLVVVLPLLNGKEARRNLYTVVGVVGIVGVVGAEAEETEVVVLEAVVVLRVLRYL